MGRFTVHVRTSVPLEPYNDPYAFIVKHRVKVTHRPGGKGTREEAGRFTLARVLAGKALECDHDVHEAGDADSELLNEACLAAFDPDTGGFRQSVLKPFGVPAGADLLVVESLTLAPRWHRSRLGPAALRKALDLCEGGCGLVVCRPPEGEGGAVLRRCLRRLGYRMGRDGFFAQSPADVNPTVEDLLRKKA
jgi:hypothetical protein